MNFIEVLIIRIPVYLKNNDFIDKSVIELVHYSFVQFLFFSIKRYARFWRCLCKDKCPKFDKFKRRELMKHFAFLASNNLPRN